MVAIGMLLIQEALALMNQIQLKPVPNIQAMMLKYMSIQLKFSNVQMNVITVNSILNCNLVKIHIQVAVTVKNIKNSNTKPNLKIIKNIGIYVFKIQELSVQVML